MPPQQQKHLWAGEFKFQQRVVCVQFQVQTKNEGKLVGIGVGEGIRRRHFPNPFRAPLQQPSHLFLGLRKQQSHSNNSFLSLSLSLSLWFRNSLNLTLNQNLRVYDVDASLLRLQAPSQAPLLDCCFQDDAVAFAAASDGLIRRSSSNFRFHFV